MAKVIFRPRVKPQFKPRRKPGLNEQLMGATASVSGGYTQVAYVIPATDKGGKRNHYAKRGQAVHFSKSTGKRYVSCHHRWVGVDNQGKPKRKAMATVKQVPEQHRTYGTKSLGRANCDWIREAEAPKSR